MQRGKNQFVCVSVTESVREHTERVERSTDRNLPPIFTKLATTVESQEMWLPIVFVGNPKVELILTIAPMERYFYVRYLENGERYDVGPKGGQIVNRPCAFDWHHDFDLDHHEPS